MIKNINERIQDYFPYEHNEILSDDFVLVYPTNKDINGLGVQDTKDALQKIAKFLEEITGLKLGDGLMLKEEARFHPRIVIGYHGSSYEAWVFDNTIKLSEDCLDEENKTITACTHELVHPFFKIFFYTSENLNKIAINENWGEGFCDFLRIFIIDILDMNLKEKINGKEYNWKEDNFEDYMRSTEITGDHWEGCHKLALRLLKEFKKFNQNLEDQNKSIKERLKMFLGHLYQKEDLDRDITEDFS